jgi:sulfonate transport system substrate-binding protein
MVSTRQPLLDSHFIQTEDVLLRAYTAQRTTLIVIDAAVIAEFRAASDPATPYGILARPIDVSKAVDRSFTAAAAGSN